MSSRVLSDWLDAYLKYTVNSEPPLNYKLWVGISVIASCLKRKCVLNWGTLTIYPNMYIVLVGPSGKCRKGTAMAPGMKFLNEMGIKMSAESITREALIRELRDSNDSTVNIATGEVHLHASLTIFSQELTVFLGYNNQALMSDLTDWYDCRNKWTYRTKNMGTDDIQGVWVNLIGATTPELIQTTLPMDAIGGGLTSRIIFVYEHRKSRIVACPFLSIEEREIERKLLNDLDKICMLAGEFKVTEDFIDTYAPWYSNYSMADPLFPDYRFAGYLERRPMHLLKLCMILSASRSSSMQITSEDFHRAIKVLEAIEVKMPYTFSGVGKSDSADVIQRVMAVLAANNEMEFSDLMRMFYQDVDKLSLEKIVEMMISMDYATVDLSGGKRLIKYSDKHATFKF